MCRTRLNSPDPSHVPTHAGRRLLLVHTHGITMLHKAASARAGYGCQSSWKHAHTRLHAVDRVPIAVGGAIPWMVLSRLRVAASSASTCLLLSAAVSRLYVRILRPDKKCCTLQRRPGAAIQVRHRAEHAVARKSCTQCATIANERFVTGFGLPRVQLAMY